jgi:peroxiredoxin
MITAFFLLTTAFAPAQTPVTTQWMLAPRFTRAQELVYKGTTSEETLGNAVQCNRTYRLENRIFVMGMTNKGAEVAIFTRLRERPATTEKAPAAQKEAAQSGSVRLELATISTQGRVASTTGTALQIPLGGPATCECGAIVEVPNRRVGRDQTWENTEEGRPPTLWTIGGLENVLGNPCVKLVGVQQSEDWDHPRADHMAWQRRDNVWISTRSGIPCRVERTIEQREPAHREPTQRIVTKFDLESSITYPGQLYDDRVREITHARNFADGAAPLLQDPGRYGASVADGLLTKINRYVDTQPPTPYREAVLQVKRRIEVAKQGRSTTVTTPTVSAVATASVGQPAPDFVVPGAVTKEQVRLQKLLGRPTLLLFYTPTSATAEEMLNFAQRLHTSSPTPITVIGLAMTDDNDALVKQYEHLKLTFPVGIGKGLRLSYQVEATPKVVLLDSDGVVRSSYVGWGSEIPGAVTEELHRWQRGSPQRQDR